MGGDLVVAPVAASFLVFILVAAPDRWKEQLVVAYLSRFALAVVHHSFAILPDSQFDAIRFERLAWLWAEDSRCFDNFNTGSELYPWIGSCIYIWSGRSSLLLQTLNCALGTLIVAFGMATVRAMAPQSQIDRRVGWWLSVYPSLMLYSAITMREVAIVLPFVGSVYCLVKWRIAGRYRLLPWAVLWAVVGQLFHTGMITVTVSVLAIGSFYVMREHGRHLFRVRFRRLNLGVTLGALVLTGVIVGAAWIAFSAGYAIDKLQRLLTTDFVTALSSWQGEVARGRASYLGWLSPGNLLDLVVQAPVRLVYFLGSPFLWQISGIGDLFGFLDGLVYVVLFVVVLRHIRKGAIAHPTYRMIALIAILAIVGFALVTSNYGTAFRHRAKFLPILVTLVAYGTSLTCPVRKRRL